VLVLVILLVLLLVLGLLILFLPLLLLMLGAARRLRGRRARSLLPFLILMHTIATIFSSSCVTTTIASSALSPAQLLLLSDPGRDGVALPVFQARNGYCVPPAVRRWVALDHDHLLRGAVGVPVDRTLRVES
jgi:hypothetical protein